MSVVIVGGNECMARRYEEICAEYSCSARIYTKSVSGITNIGTPDLLVLFTNTMSHKMLDVAAGQAKKKNIPIARCHSSSMSALRNILSENTAGGAERV